MLTQQRFKFLEVLSFLPFPGCASVLLNARCKCYIKIKFSFFPNIWKKRQRSESATAKFDFKLLGALRRTSMHKKAGFLLLSWLPCVEWFQLAGVCTGVSRSQDFTLEGALLLQHPALHRGRFAYQSCFGRDSCCESKSSNG